MSKFIPCGENRYCDKYFEDGINNIQQPNKLQSNKEETSKK